MSLNRLYWDIRGSIRFGIAAAFLLFFLGLFGGEGGFTQAIWMSGIGGFAVFLVLCISSIRRHTRRNQVPKAPLVWLNVPFKEKETAKAMGARWSPTSRQWFVPSGIDPTPFSKWFPPY